MKKEPLICYRGKRKYIKIIWITMIRSIFYSFKKLIIMTESFINKSISDRNILNCITPSGRTALNCIFSLPYISSIVLPEYICNVVSLAATNKRIYYYSVGNDYKPNIQEIVEIISNKPNCCLVLSSYLNREINIDQIQHQIREINNTCTIVFDECQNMSSILNLPPLDNHTFAVYSFNNKMTYGFIGGAIIQGKENHTEAWKFTPAHMTDNLHGMVVILKYGIKDVVAAITKRNPIPTDPDISYGKGIYSVSYRHILKVSVAASSLLADNWEWYSSCIKENKETMKQIANEGCISIIPGMDDSLMPYLPIKNKLEELQGRIPLKGRYGVLSDTAKKRDICLILHNSMRMEIMS